MRPLKITKLHYITYKLMNKFSSGDSSINFDLYVHQINRLIRIQNKYVSEVL